MYRRFGKRLLDLAVSSCALVVLSPVLAALFWLVRGKLGSPALFRQVRPGRNGRPFTLIKFRSMTYARDRNGVLLSDADRLGLFGHFLRMSSLDELPELWNVLKGDMSLVGPRPLLMEYLTHYTPEQARRHDVLPGITGWAQINGRHEALFSERLKLDVWYVDHISFWLDLKIILLTLRHVLDRKGVKPEQDVATVDDIGLSVDLPSRSTVSPAAEAPRD